MSTLLNLQQQLAWWLKQEALREALEDAVDHEYMNARAEWDAKFETENAELCHRHDRTSQHRKEATLKVQALREQAKQALTGDRQNDLPEGFKQTKEKALVIQEFASRGDLREAVMKEMPALLVVDTKALEKLAFAVAVENGAGGFNLPDWLLRLPVMVDMQYKASISDKTLLQHAPAEEPVNEPEDTDKFYSAVDPLTLKNGETTIAHIVEWRRTQLNDTGATWVCTSREGFEFSIMLHRLVRLNNFALFVEAGYSEDLHGLAVGQSQSWTQHPIQVEIQKAGEFWRIVGVTERPKDAMPDGAIVQKVETVEIIGLARGETSTSASPKWTCTTSRTVPKGLRIFKHEDAEKDSYHQFAAAGYGDALDSMSLGDTQDWTQHPIRVTIAENDGWWNIIGVEQRPDGAEPDPIAVEPVQDEVEDGAVLEKLRSSSLADVDFDGAAQPSVMDDEVPF